MCRVYIAEDGGSSDTRQATTVSLSEKQLLLRVCPCVADFSLGSALFIFALRCVRLCCAVCWLTWPFCAGAIIKNTVCVGAGCLCGQPHQNAPQLEGIRFKAGTLR